MNVKVRSAKKSASRLKNMAELHAFFMNAMPRFSNPHAGILHRRFLSSIRRDPGMTDPAQPAFVDSKR